MLWKDSLDQGHPVSNQMKYLEQFLAHTTLSKGQVLSTSAHKEMFDSIKWKTYFLQLFD